MITTTYNPSPIETEFAQIIQDLKDQIQSKLKSNSIQEIIVNKDKDNPDLLFILKDNDGDRHELVLKLIQRADQHL